MRDRDKLLNELTGIFTINVIKQKRHQILMNLDEKIDFEKLSELIDGKIQIYMFRDNELYHLTNELWKLIVEDKYLFGKLTPEQQGLKEDLNPRLYFTENEIKQYSVTLLDKNNEKNDSNIITFECCQKVSDWQYETTIDMNDFLELFENGKIIYNYDCQREKEKLIWRGNYIIKPKVYQDSVKEIAEEMIKSKYTPTTISINIPKPDEGFDNFDTKLVFQSNKKEIHDVQIVLDQFTMINLIDGMHRVLAAQIARREVESSGGVFSQKMNLNIMNVDVFKAKNFIAQESKKNALDERWTNSLEDRFSNKLMDYLNRSSNSLLFGKLAQDYEEIKILNRLDTLGHMAESYDKFFKIDEKNIIEIKKMKRRMLDYFNYLLSIFKSELDNIIESRKNNLKLNHNMFEGYLYIASLVKDSEFWEEDLENIINKIDFNKEGALSFLKKSELTNEQSKKLKLYIDNIVDNIVNKNKNIV